jgi:hypothetical protein
MACAERLLTLWKQFHPDDRVLEGALQAKRQWLARSATGQDVQEAERRVRRLKKQFEVLGLQSQICETVRQCCELDADRVIQAAKTAGDVVIAFFCEPNLWIEQTLADLLIEILERRRDAKAQLSDWHDVALRCLRRRRTSIYKAMEMSKAPRLWCVGSECPDRVDDTLFDAAAHGSKCLFFCHRGEVGPIIDWERLLLEYRMRAVEPLVKYWQAEFRKIKQIPRAVNAMRGWIAGKVSDRALLNAIRACVSTFQKLQGRSKSADSEAISVQRTMALAVGLAAMHLGPSIHTFPAYVQFTLDEAHEMLEDAANGCLPPEPPENETPERRVARFDDLLRKDLARLEPDGYTAYRRKRMKWILDKTLAAIGKIKNLSRLQKAAKAKLVQELALIT